MIRFRFYGKLLGGLNDEKYFCFIVKNLEGLGIEVRVFIWKVLLNYYFRFSDCYLLFFRLNSFRVL